MVISDNNDRSKDFPILETRIHGKPLVYLDSAASAQKPQCVLDAVSSFYQKEYANIHRGLHSLSERATESFESVRDQLAAFIGASSAKEIVFTSGATAAINLVAECFSSLMLSQGDNIVVTRMEHHANFVPWQRVCQRYGAELRIVSITDEGLIDEESLAELLDERTRLFAFSHMSNVLGSINDVKKITQIAHDKGIPVLIDGAQGVVHAEVNVSDIDCDFYVASSHKLYGPTGVGFLYAKASWLEKLPPYQCGGEMIDYVGDAESTYASIPHKFEAGTPNIAGVIGFGSALSYLNRIDREASYAHEAYLARRLHEGLSSLSGVRVYGPPANKRTGLVSFSVDGVHAHDIGMLLDRRGIAVRVGHHCAQPLMRYFGVDSTLRASLGIYSKDSDVDALLEALPLIISMVRGV